MSVGETPRRGLGRGLSALLGEASHEQPLAAGASRSGGVRMMPIAHVRPNPDQPRRHFDDTALDELAASITARGLIQPILVRPHPHNETYQIVAGERRWRAAQRARLHEVPVIVRELSDGETLELAIVENVQRQDLNAIEEAASYQKLMQEFGYTHEGVGTLVGKSRSHVANLLRLLDLPPPVRAMVIDGSLSMGHARALIGAPDPELLAAEVVRKGLSVRETEKLANSNKAPAGKRRSAKPALAGDADVEALERHLGDILGLKVAIEHGDTGSGRISVAYSTLDQLDLICQRLTGGGI